MSGHELIRLAAWIGYGALGGYLGFLLFKALRSVRWARVHPETNIADGDVTILQPILSGDPQLEAALSRNVSQLPSWVRFIWLVDEDDREAQHVVQRLASQWPGRVECVMCPPAVPDTNPKTAKLDIGLRVVTTPCFAVLDDDTTIEESNLTHALASLQHADLYTGLPYYKPGVGCWSSLVAHFVNNNSIVTYLSLLDWIGPITINGMFYVMRSDVLRRMGGFQSIETRLCDDYAVATLVHRHGGTIIQGTTSQQIETTIAGPRQYARVMHRWFVFANVLVQAQSWVVQSLLIVMLGLPPLLLWAGFLSLLSGYVGAVILASSLVVRHTVIRCLHRLFFKPLPAFSPVVSLVSELLQPLHWLHAAISPTIIWRTRRIHVHADGSFVSLG